VRAVADLLSTEDDPALRTMAKTYADRLSSKLVVMGRSPTDLHQLERIMEQATSGAKRSVPLASQSAERGDRARSRAQVDSIPQAMLGALLDFPDLLDDPECEEALGFLDGDAALAVAAMRQHLIAAPHEDAIIEPSEGDAPARTSPNKGLYADEFLAQIPRPIHSFAVGRLASPQFEQIADAKFELLENARKLKRLSLTRENAAGVDQLHRAEAQGDVDAEMALLREIDLSNRKKRGLV
jgi:DNA primase